MSDMMPPSSHPDAPQDQMQIDSNLQGIIQELVPILEHLAQKVNYLEDRVDNQLIGGLKSAYEKQARGEKVNAIKERWNDKFNDLITSLTAAVGGGDDFDPWDSIYGKMDELGVGDDDEGDFMDMLHGHLSKKKEEMLKALMGSGGAPDAAISIEAAGEPEAIAEAAPAAVEQVKEAAKKAPEMKKSPPAVGSPEFFAEARGGRKAPPKAQK